MFAQCVPQATRHRSVVLPLGGFGHGVMEELKAQTPDEPRVEGVGAWLGAGSRSGKSRATVPDSASPRSSSFSPGSRAMLV